MEENNQKEEAFKLLIEAVNNSTEELYRLRKREITLLQKVLNSEKKITSLISQLADAKFPKPEKS